MPSLCISLSEVQGALHLFPGFWREAVQIDHRRPDIGMAEQRLDRAEVVAGLKHVRGVGMTKGVWRDALRKLGLSDRFAESFLHPRIMHMIAPRFFRLSDEGQ